MIERYISSYLIQKCLSAIFTFLFVFAQVGLHGQSSLKGRLHDTGFNKDCSLAVVTLLEPDSTLVRYSRSRKDGSFFFKDLTPGNYQLLVTHPSYSPYLLSIHIDSGGSIDVGILALFPRADALAPVIVTPRNLSPRLRNDTLEYNTAHVRMRVNATVEELLHRLPGVQVDADGQIMVNGQKIERLLVDGKDFFNGAPILVTHNFNGDMIAKVQVLDKKSQQAEFTGVDDGHRTKTLNLVLKEDSKRGSLMKIQAGGDTQGYYNAGGLLGSFKGRMQFAALGMVANTGASDFGDDMEGRRSGIFFGGGGGDPLGASAGSGIPRVVGGSIHYANDWEGKEGHVVSNYQYGRVTTAPSSISLTRQTLPDSIYVQQQQSNSENIREQHSLGGSFEFAPDTVSGYRLFLGGNSMQGQNVFNSIGSSSFNGTLVNSSQRTIRSEAGDQDYQGSLMLRRRARQSKERIFSITIGFSRQQNTTKGFLYSLNDFFQPGGTLLRTDTTDQRKDISSENLILDGSVNYTLPMKKSAVLEFSYGLNYNSSRAIQGTYNRGDGKYEAFVDSLSNHYLNNVLGQRGTVNLQSHKGNLIYAIGGDLLHYDYKETDVLKGSFLRYRYLNFTPRIGTRINITPQKAINIDYTGSTQQPPITQLQPVQNNNDPLHVTMGNPNLHGSFSHHIGFKYADYSSGFFITNLDYNLTSNGISTRTYTDSLGRQISQAVNVDGAHDVNLSIFFSRKIKPLNVDVSVISHFSYARSVNYVNQYLSRNNNYITGGGVALSKFVPERYNFDLRANFTYTYSNSSINTAQPVHYWTQIYNGKVSVFPIPGLEIGTTAIYNWRQRLDNFDTRNSTFLLNAYAAKDLLKNQLNIRWQINDILGQNAGISRTSTANQTSENAVNVLGRYWMLSATWRFVHHRKLN